MYFPFSPTQLCCYMLVLADNWGGAMNGFGNYMKKATLGRYYSDAAEHQDRFMPVDAVAALEAESSYPHITSALAELKGITLSYDDTPRNTKPGGVNADVILLSQRFAILMGEYTQSIEDGVISINEAKRLLRETTALQKVLIEMKLHLEQEAD